MASFGIGAAATTAQTAVQMAAGAALWAGATLGIGALESMGQQPQAQAPTAPPQPPPAASTNSGWVKTLQQRGQLK